MSKEMFDQSAVDFAETTDRAIASETYVRGQLFIDALKRHVHLGARVLDFGCGPGRIARMAAEAGYDVEGADSSTGMIAVANSQVTGRLKLRFRECDGLGDDLETARYDAIVCSSVIEYIPEANRLLRNFTRATRPGAVLAISYANKRSVWRAYVRQANRDKPHYAVQCNIWSFAEMAGHLSQAGFQVLTKPVFLEASAFDKRPALRFMSRSALIGTLGFVVASKA